MRLRRTTEVLIWTKHYFVAMANNQLFNRLQSILPIIDCKSKNRFILKMKVESICIDCLFWKRRWNRFVSIAMDSIIDCEKNLVVQWTTRCSGPVLINALIWRYLFAGESRAAFKCSGDYVFICTSLQPCLPTKPHHHHCQNQQSASTSKP